MGKWSASNIKSPMSNQRGHFYSSEILSDFQKRVKATEVEKKNVPEPVQDHVGMETISPTSNQGRFFVEFASSANIHGLNHLVAPHRHPIEKFLAVMFIVGALCALIILSLTFWDRYQNEATVIVIDNDVSTFRIAKPAYFVWPMINFKKGNVSHIFEAHGVEYSQESEKFFQFLSGADYENMQYTPAFDRVPSSKWLALLYDLRPDIPTDFLQVRNRHVKGEWTITERGFCIAFRSIISVYASFDYWMQNNFTVVPLPTEIPYFDHHITSADIDYISVDHPFWISYIHPNNMIDYVKPRVPVETRIVHLDTQLLLQLTTTQEVRDLPVHQRKCKIPSDKGLATSPTYNLGMCTIECRMNIIQNLCGCRPHFVRPISGIPICNAQQLRCIADVKDKLLLNALLIPNCDCFPMCDIVQYSIIDSFRSILQASTPTNFSTYRTNVEFSTVTYRQTVIFGFNAFLTSVGGAAGLFLGASVLSFVEIFYYITLRMCAYMINLRYKNTKKKAQIRTIAQLKEDLKRGDI